MADFFDEIKAVSPPELSDLEINNILNEVEICYFANNPAALDLPEHEQNALIIEAYKNRKAN